MIRHAIAVLLFASAGAMANTEIYSCLQDDGTVAFQQMPCPAPAAGDDDDGNEIGESPEASELPAADDDALDFVNPFDEPASPPPPAEADLPEPVSLDRAECEKTTRDAIDAIDLEIRENPYTKEQRDAYLAELLELTQQLRACKRL